MGRPGPTPLSVSEAADIEPEKGCALVGVAAPASSALSAGQSGDDTASQAALKRKEEPPTSRTHVAAACGLSPSLQPEVHARDTRTQHAVEHTTALIQHVADDGTAYPVLQPARSEPVASEASNVWNFFFTIYFKYEFFSYQKKIACTTIIYKEKKIQKLILVCIHREAIQRNFFCDT
jgi:hypothetical protein